MLLDCLGIKNTEATGIAITRDGGGVHAWNRVEIDGKWYYIDLFWCANLQSKSTYFLTENIWDDHIMFSEGNDHINENGDVSYIRSLH
ncbi:hypothetical protein [Lachnoclostridium phytofermentans]|uniref:Transglutaminase-like domain-containing protein n=1 Tax=Lachnoclostridium phytofermentans (strain ATCC 700394 / DSM 18823 / ISDg) TaxID=357809 RepID=A9KQU3_LACP7|nr:hypothetical protein [Lachnoclostridium phytofermentans]ABX43422.1 hypothetical protein Cphy_3065 [Lachnoclostridium phytofermentans ISDg]